MASTKKTIDSTWRFPILGKEWTLVLMTQTQMTDYINQLHPDDPTIPSVKAWGVTLYARRQILIDVKLLGTHAFKSTIGHELTHAMLEMLTQMEEYQEELICDCIGPQLFDISEVLQTMPKGWR